MGRGRTDDRLTAYLAEQATTLKVATLTRRPAAISVAHKAQRLPSPVSSPLVRATMRGVRREHGTAQRQAAPLLREDLFVVLGAMGDRLKDLRDRALLLVGFAGGLRRSELAAIDLIEQTGHASDAMLSRYVRDGELFIGNAAGVLL